MQPFTETSPNGEQFWSEKHYTIKNTLTILFVIISENQWPCKWCTMGPSVDFRIFFTIPQSHVDQWNRTMSLSCPLTISVWHEILWAMIEMSLFVFLFNLLPFSFPALKIKVFIETLHRMETCTQVACPSRTSLTTLFSLMKRFSS